MPRIRTYRRKKNALIISLDSPREDSSDEETSPREKSEPKQEPIRHTVTALNNAPTQSLSVQGKGVRRRTRSKGSKKKRSRGKRTTNRRRH